jgi:hypothetical protein
LQIFDFEPTGVLDSQSTFSTSKEYLTITVNKDTFQDYDFLVKLRVNNIANVQSKTIFVGGQKLFVFDSHRVFLWLER